MTPRISVVVPTRNNERTLAACLHSVQMQTHPEVELLVIDNHSTDATEQIARSMADVFVVAGPERSAQRNEGIRRSTGEWIVWLDSDMILPPETLEVALRTALETGATGVALPERTVGRGFWTACRALERSCYLDDPWLHNPRLIKKSYLENEGGFHLGMSGPEDADLRLRMHADGAVITLAPVLVDHDEGQLTIKDVLSKRYYYGRSIPAFADEHRGAVSSQAGALVRSYGRHWRQLAADPAHALGMLFLRALEVGGYAAGARRGRRDRARASQR